MRPASRHPGGTLLRRIRAGVRVRRNRRRLPADAFLENRREARRLVALGERELTGKRLPAAKSLALGAIAAAPSALEAYRLLGRVLDGQGYAELALVCYRGLVPEEVRDARLDAPGVLLVDASGVRHDAPVPPERTLVHDTELHELPEPLGVAPAAPEVFSRRCIVAAPAYVDRVRGGRAWQDAHNTIVFDRSGHAIEEHTLGNERVVRHLAAAHEPVHIGRRAFVLGARGSGNYYHWMTDILPKLELCRLAGYRFEAEDRFVLPSRRSAFQLDSLARFGIAERQVHFANISSPYVVADELIVPFLKNAMGTTMGSWVPDFLKRTFLPSGERPRATRRIFASRNPGRSQGRSVTNLAQIETYLASRGFEIVHPETLSLEGQARLFAESSVVVAPHGAGLANIAFCSPGTRIIEFYGAHLAPCYRAIAALTGLEYHAHHCLGEAKGGDGHTCVRSLAERRTEGFAIDIDATRALLDLAGVN